MEENIQSMTDEVLLTRYRFTGDLIYRNALVERYSYLAEILAKKFLQRGVDYDDLYQVAMLALIKAVERFDIKMGNKLSTFLTPSIVGELKNYFRDKTSMLKMSRETTRVYGLVRRAIAELSAKTGRTPTSEEVAQHLGIPLERVLTSMEYGFTMVSLDSTVADSDTSLSEVIADERDPYAEVENRDFFESCLRLLNEPEQKLVTLRFVKELSQAEVAKELGVSQMFVSRLERKILQKLKATFSER